ncbi:hypothetical protein [Shumkonia mesophila]|uniref:hypothetical protein n=1 Tax=Shumkonia mesophila TaxID=2838854 RepID=UPI002934C04C|nr:hypothetical protein [Shumkonia mesophila]
MNHLETLTAEWLGYNGYFVRTAVKVGRRANGGWDGELDVVGFHPAHRHLLHVECSIDADTWVVREDRFSRKFAIGRRYVRDLFSGIELPAELDQVVVHGYASAAEKHRLLGKGRLITCQELTAEIASGIPASTWKNAVPETYPLLRTLQLAKMAGARLGPPMVRLIQKLDMAPVDLSPQPAISTR